MKRFSRFQQGLKSVLFMGVVIFLSGLCSGIAGAASLNTPSRALSSSGAVNGGTASKLVLGQLIRAGQLTINNRRVRCGRIPALISEHYPDYGAARPGLIILNPARLRSLPKAARLVIYYHECAHQYVGRSELAADCWAVQKARRDGLLNRAGLVQACTFIKGLTANRHHPPGPLRCRHMTRCFNETFRAKAPLEMKSVQSDKSTQSRGFSKPAGDLIKDIYGEIQQ